MRPPAKTWMSRRLVRTARRLVILVNLMTKILSKTFTAAVSAAIFLGASFPALTAAQTAEGATSTGRGGAAREAVCGKFADFSARVGQQMADRLAKLATARTARTENLEHRRDERDGRRTDNRLRWDENRSLHFAKLEERAATDAQKQAMAAFKAAVEAAIAARRTAVNAAIQTFRDGVSQAITDRKLAVDRAVADFQGAVNAALG